MAKYLISRLLRGLFSIAVVVCIVMVLVFSCIDRNQIFVMDPNFSHHKLNNKEIYKLQQWEKYGYIDYVTYDEYVNSLGLEESERKTAIQLGLTADKDNKTAKIYIEQFKQEYSAKGFRIERLEGIAKSGTKKPTEGGKPHLYAVRDVPITNRIASYFGNLISFDNVHYAKGDVGERGLSFTLYDPAYGGEKFSPAIMGNGTKHKYLFYINDEFPYIQQNLITVNLGTSFVKDRGNDVFKTLTTAQGGQKFSQVTYPTGLSEQSADNLHSATYVQGSLEKDPLIAGKRYVDDYTNVTLSKDGFSRLGYSFVIGIISVIMSYVLAVPLGTLMALKKDKLIDKIGTLYIIFIIAVPSLAYIFMFKAIGQSVGLPTIFDTVNPTWKMYILPIVSLALPSVAGLMKWLRRYMIDQMNSDYVKFARSNGLSEGEIFSKHILKNAIIPIIHGIPGSVLGALVGAIITERVYAVPGAGNILTEAINSYDNGVIVGVTLFYALLSVVSIIFGDILMSMVDPRINFSSKAR